MNRFVLLIALAAGGPSFAADEPARPHNETHTAEQQGHDKHSPAGVELDEQRLTEFGARVAEAGPGVIRRQITLPGEVKLNREAVAHITPRFPAKVVKVTAQIGDRVEAGQVLAVAESSDTLAQFELKSLIEGTVINRHITLGEMLTPSDNAFVVADLSTLWVDIDLYPRQVARVRVGQPVRIATAHGPAPVKTQIDYLSPLVEERTRTGLARVFLDNDNGQWKPGMFVSAAITLNEVEAGVVVPKTALIKLEGEDVVFVDRDGRWKPHPVETGREDTGRVEIRQGLHPGERYVADGGFVLKAQIQKSEFESGHHH